MKGKPNCFRFLLVDDKGRANVITQDRRRSRNVITGRSSVFYISDLQGWARAHECSIIVRPKAATRPTKAGEI